MFKHWHWQEFQGSFTVSDCERGVEMVFVKERCEGERQTKEK